MARFGAWQYRISRQLGRAITRTCAILTLGRMPPFVATSALVTKKGQVLVVIDPILAEPVLPGGHVQWSEAPLDGVVREVREETGYIVEPVRLLGAYSGKSQVGEPGVVRLVYSCSIVAGLLRSSAEGEARWLELSDATLRCGRDGELIQSLFDSGKLGV